MDSEIIITITAREMSTLLDILAAHNGSFSPQEDPEAHALFHKIEEQAQMVA